MENISVFGLGFVGLPLSLTYTLYGVKVYGVDVNTEYISKLKEYKTHVHEEYQGKSISEILKESIQKGLFVPTDSYREAIGNSSGLIVTVGIPIENGKLNMEVFNNAIREIGKHLRRGQVVLVRSTVPPGTTREVVLPILENESNMKCGRDFFLAYSSERIAEGNAFDEFQTMPVAVAGVDPLSTEKGREILRIINKEVIVSSQPEVVEISKLVENSSRDVNIALVNEIASLTEKMGVDIMEVIRVANTHKRVRLLSPGVGVGGHCIPYSSSYIFHKTDKMNLEMPLLHVARSVNDNRPLKILELLEAAMERKGIQFKQSKIAFIGIAMKDNSSDASESPIVEMMELARSLGARVFWYDPLVDNGIEGKVNTLEAVLGNADAVIIPITQPSLALDIDSISSITKTGCIIFDVKRIFDRETVEKLGLTYLTI